MDRRRGALRVGTSGFAYPAWRPAFYPAGSRPEGFLRYYSERLAACELNGTFYRVPNEPQVLAWCEATPPDFRFSVKAHHGGSRRALTDPSALSWVLRPMPWFGARLGSVLVRVAEDIERDDGRLATFVAAWPRDLPLTLEFRNTSWHVDETFETMRSAGAVLCTTEFESDPEPPTLRLTGPFLYLRLRRDSYDEHALDEWAVRLEPFLADGRDVYAFFRHDQDGLAPGWALGLAARLQS